MSTPKITRTSSVKTEEALQLCRNFFVYGTLKFDYHNARIFKQWSWANQQPIIVSETETEFDDYCLACRFIPMAYIRPTGVVRARIRGEMYEIPDSPFDVQLLRSLDRLEGYPFFYDRSLVDLANGRQAWMYHASEEFGFEPDPLDLCPVVNGAYEWTYDTRERHHAEA